MCVIRMILETTEIKKLATALQGVGRIVDEIELRVNEGGVEAHAIDGARITYTHLHLDPKLFDEYSLKGPVSLHVDLEEVNKILQRGRGMDRLQITDEEDGRLSFIFEGDFRRRFDVSLIDTHYGAPGAPEIDLPASCTAPTRFFYEAVQDAALYASALYGPGAVEVTLSEYTLTIRGVGDQGASEAKYYHNSDVDGAYTAHYSLDKVQDILAGRGFSDRVRVSLGEDGPIRLEFIDDCGALSFLLAPRVREEGS